MKKNDRITWIAIQGLIVLIVFGLSGCNRPNPPEKTDMPAFIPLTSGVQTVWGQILEGGDQSPKDLMDAPRTFIYQVRLDSGEEIHLTYTAYPPSPTNQNQPGPQLTFHNGTISAGDYVVAQGTYDSEAHTLSVALESDFIETFLERP